VSAGATDGDALSDMAGGLGLEDYQLELLGQLVEQADRQGIPREVLPILAKYLDRIDWDPLLATPSAAAGILGVSERSLGDMIQSSFEWMAPFIWVRGPSGETVVRVWLAAKVRAFHLHRRE